jgi:hypothetical protein
MYVGHVKNVVHDLGVLERFVLDFVNYPEIDGFLGRDQNSRRSCQQSGQMLEQHGVPFAIYLL